MRSGRDWIERLGLSPHPEGGFYRETYRSSDVMELPDRFARPRALATSIIYLLMGDDFSALHRLRSDEIWHFYEGSPLVLAWLGAEAEAAEIHLGRDPERGQVLQAVMPAGRWFGALVLEPDSYSLVGCGLSPGFDFADFELGERRRLLELYPGCQPLIERLTR